MAKHETSKVKKGDTVVVLNGKDNGKQAKVMRILSKKNRILLERVNIVKKHQKPTQNSQGGIVDKEASIHISNVKILCPKCNKGVRIGHKIHDDGNKVRVCRTCGEELDR